MSRSTSVSVSLPRDSLSPVGTQRRLFDGFGDDEVCVAVAAESSSMAPAVLSSLCAAAVAVSSASSGRGSSSSDTVFSTATARSSTPPRGPLLLVGELNKENEEMRFTRLAPHDCPSSHALSSATTMMMASTLTTKHRNSRQSAAASFSTNTFQRTIAVPAVLIDGGISPAPHTPSSPSSASSSRTNSPEPHVVVLVDVRSTRAVPALAGHVTNVMPTKTEVKTKTKKKVRAVRESHQDEEKEEKEKEAGERMCRDGSSGRRRDVKSRTRAPQRSSPSSCLSRGSMTSPSTAAVASAGSTCAAKAAPRGRTAPPRSSGKHPVTKEPHVFARQGSSRPPLPHVSKATAATMAQPPPLAPCQHLRRTNSTRDPLTHFSRTASSSAANSRSSAATTTTPPTTAVAGYQRSRTATSALTTSSAASLTHTRADPLRRTTTREHGAMATRAALGKAVGSPSHTHSFRRAATATGGLEPKRAPAQCASRVQTRPRTQSGHGEKRATAQKVGGGLTSVAAPPTQRFSRAATYTGSVPVLTVSTRENEGEKKEEGSGGGNRGGETGSGSAGSRTGNVANSSSSSAHGASSSAVGARATHRGTSPKSDARTASRQRGVASRPASPTTTRTRTPSATSKGRGAAGTVQSRKASHAPLLPPPPPSLRLGGGRRGSAQTTTAMSHIPPPQPSPLASTTTQGRRGASTQARRPAARNSSSHSSNSRRAMPADASSASRLAPPPRQLPQHQRSSHAPLAGVDTKCIKDPTAAPRTRSKKRSASAASVVTQAAAAAAGGGGNVERDGRVLQPALHGRRTASAHALTHAQLSRPAATGAKPTAGAAHRRASVAESTASNNKSTAAVAHGPQYTQKPARPALAHPARRPSLNAGEAHTPTHTSAAPHSCLVSPSAETRGVGEIDTHVDPSAVMGIPLRVSTTGRASANIVDDSAHADAHCGVVVMSPPSESAARRSGSAQPRHASPVTVLQGEGLLLDSHKATTDRTQAEMDVEDEEEESPSPVRPSAVGPPRMCVPALPLDVLNAERERRASSSAAADGEAEFDVDDDALECGAQYEEFRRCDDGSVFHALAQARERSAGGAATSASAVCDVGSGSGDAVDGSNPLQRLRLVRERAAQKAAARAVAQRATPCRRQDSQEPSLE